MFVFLLPTWPAVSQRPRVIVRLVSLWSTWSTQRYFYIRKLIMLCDSHRHLSLIIVKHRWHILVREHILCVNNQKTGFTCKGLSCCLFINIWIITTPNWAWKVRQLYQCTWVPTLLLVFPSSSFYLLLLLYLFLPPLTNSSLLFLFLLLYLFLLS